jgi:ATP-binding cassette subfamily F protein 3
VRRASQLSEEGARSFLGRFLFSGEDVFKPVGALSGGERSRVALAKLTLQGANFLVLDEPTNHLDLPAREALETILREYDGTLLFVSHDRYFVDGLATTIWSLEDGVVSVYEGNYTRYRTLRAQAALRTQARQSAEAQELAASGGQGDRAASARARTGKRSKRGDAAAERTAEQVEREITAHEARMTALVADLASASANGDLERISELGEEYERERALLDALYIEWQALAS